MLFIEENKGTWGLRLGTGEHLMDLVFMIREDGRRFEPCRPTAGPPSSGERAGFYLGELWGEVQLRSVTEEITSIRVTVSNHGTGERRITSVAPIVYRGDWTDAGLLNVSRKTVVYTTPAERNYGFDGASTIARNKPLISFWFISLHDPERGDNLLIGIDDVPDAFVRFALHPVQSDTEDMRVLQLRCECDCRSGVRGVRLRPDSSISPVSLSIVRWKGDHEKGRERFGDYLGKRFSRSIHSSPPAGWCSWYTGSGAAIDEAEVRRNLVVARSIPSMRVLQIDDGWMAQPAATPEGLPLEDRIAFPSGMHRLAQEISGAGMIPGLWMRPFRGWGENPALPSWARGSSLDLSHPAALQWIEAYTRNIASVWGYGYIKFDFVTFDFCGSWGMQFDPFPPASFDPSDDTLTNARMYRRGLEAIRRGAGESCFLLGCNCLLAPALGLIDAYRIGDDVSAWNWDRTVTMGAGSIPVAGYLNGRIWWNDPDCLLFHEPLTENRVRLWNLCALLSGGVKMVSSKLHSLSPDRMDLMSKLLEIRIVENHVLRLSVHGLPELIVAKGIIDSRERLFLGLHNWTDAPRNVRVPARLGSVRSTAIQWIDYLTGAPCPFDARSERTIRLKAHDSKLLVAGEP